MGRVVDNNKINVNPCTPEDGAANWATQNIINNNVQTTLTNGGGEDTFKVAVDATDVVNATYDFLHAKIDQSATPGSPAAIPVRSETQSHLTELFAWSVQDVTGWTDTGLLVFSISDGVPGFTSVGTDVDDKTVKCDIGDGTHDFLHAKLNLHASYVGGTDILVATATVGIDTSAKTERLFVDTSAIPGYSDTGTYALLLVNNSIQLVDVSGGTVGDTYTVKSTANDTTAAYLHDAVNTNATRVSSEDAIIACQTIGSSGTNQKEEFFLDASAITAYSSIPDGETWQLSLARSGSTRTIKWAHSSSTFSYGRVKTASTFSAATGDSAAAAGTGQLYRVAADGTKTGPVDALSNYADEIGQDIPGWAFTDSDGNMWLVNVGCNRLIT